MTTYERDKRINAILSGEFDQMAETVGEAYTGAVSYNFTGEPLDTYALGAVVDELYPTLSRSDRQRVKEGARRYLATNYNIM